MTAKQLVLKDYNIFAFLAKIVEEQPQPIKKNHHTLTLMQSTKRYPQIKEIWQDPHVREFHLKKYFFKAYWLKRKYQLKKSIAKRLERLS